MSFPLSKCSWQTPTHPSKHSSVSGHLASNLIVYPPSPHLPQTQESRPPLSDPEAWPSDRVGPRLCACWGGGVEQGALIQSHLFGLRGQSHGQDRGRALGLGVLCLLIAEPKRGKETERYTETWDRKRGQDDNVKTKGPRSSLLPPPSSHSPC